MGRKKVSIEEEAVVNKVLELYPCLANDKKAILAHIKGKIQEPSTEDSKIFVDHVLEKFQYNDNTYYRDNNGYIWNADAEIIGVYDRERNIDGETQYLFFDEEINLS